MMILITLLSALSFGLIYFEYGPKWLQYSALFVSMALFLLYVLKDSLKALAKHEQIHKISKRNLMLPASVLLILLSLIVRKYDHVFDFSQMRLYSLRTDTVAWLKKVKDPVEIFVFVKKEDQTIGNIEWLQKQLAQLNAPITFHYKNINREILLAKQYGVDAPGQAVLSSNGAWVKIKNLEEDVLMPGLIRLLYKIDDVICFSTGNGEPDISDQSELGLSKFNLRLRDFGFHTKVVGLEASAQDIAQQCGTLVLPGISKPLTAEKLQTLQQLLQEKLSLVVLVSSERREDFEATLATAGVTFSEGIVVNQANLQRGASITDLFLERLYKHGITSELREKIYMPLARALWLQDGVLTWEKLMATPAEEAFQLLPTKEPGPYALAAVSQSSTGKRVAVFGSAQMIANKYMDYESNFPLLYNTINWALNQTEVSWIPLRETDEKYLRLSEGELSAIRIVFVMVLPGLALVLLLFAWLKRVWFK